MSFGMVVGAFCVVCVAASVALVYAVHEYHRRHPAAGGPEVQSLFVGAVLAFFGLFSAFMIVTTWSEYSQGLAFTSVESSSLVAVYRLSGDLPDPPNRRMRALCMEYAEAMVREEWPAMRRGGSSPTAWRTIAEMWRMMGAIGPEKLSDLPFREQILVQFIDMAKLRGQRLVRARASLPPILHAVLGLSALIVIGTLVGLDTRDVRSHAIKVGAMTLLVSLALATIWALDRPYSRGITIPPSSFELALRIMKSR